MTPQAVVPLADVLSAWAVAEPGQWEEFCAEVDENSDEWVQRHWVAVLAQPDDVHVSDRPAAQPDFEPPPVDERGLVVLSERKVMTHDQFDNLPDPIAIRARHFSEQGLTRSEAVVRAMQDPAARKAYARDVNKRNREINMGVAEGPKEPRQWREEYGSGYEGTPSGGNGRDGRSGNGPPSTVSFDRAALGQVLEQAIQTIQAKHPDWTRSQLIVAAMKLPHVAQAYDDDRAVNGEQADDD